MKRNRRDEKRERAESVSLARRELIALREGISEAYSVFNSTSDPDTIETVVLEIRALQSRYSLLLKQYKELSEVS